MTTPNETKQGQDESSQESANNDAPNGAVSEADIMALKRAHEVEVQELKEANTKLTDEMTSERTAKQAVEAKLQESDSERQRLTSETEGHVTKANESLQRIETLEGQAISSRRELVAQKHGLKPEQTKDMTESQLEALEAVLPTVSNGPNPQNLGIAGPGTSSGDTSDATPRENIRQGLNS